VHNVSQWPNLRHLVLNTHRPYSSVNNTVLHCHCGVYCVYMSKFVVCIERPFMY